MSNLEDTACFVAVLARYAPKTKPAHIIAREAIAILRDAHSLHTLAETGCNRSLTEREEKRDSRLEARVSAALKEYGVTQIDFNGDPRGCAVKVRFPNGETHGDFGGEGLWCL